MSYRKPEHLREKKSAEWFYRNKIRFEAGWITDGGKGARAIRQVADFDVINARRRKRRLAALAKAGRVSPALAKTLRLIIRNGANRRESIGALTAGKSWHRAEVLYYRHRAILLGIFEKTKDVGLWTKTR